MTNESKKRKRAVVEEVKSLESLEFDQDFGVLFDELSEVEKLELVDEVEKLELVDEVEKLEKPDSDISWIGQELFADIDFSFLSGC